MARNLTLFNKYDIFISYPIEIQTRIFELFDLLTNVYNLNVWCDLSLAKPIGLPSSVTSSLTKFVSPNQKICENINNTRLFIIAIDEPLYNYEICETELSYAILSKKRILCMMLKNKPLQEYAKLGLQILSLPKIEFYKDTQLQTKWSGLIFDKFIDLIEMMAGKKINRAQSIAITGLGISSVAVMNTRPALNSLRQVKKPVQVKRYNQVKSTKHLNIPAKRISRMSCFYSKKRILYCDPDSNQILVTDNYGSFTNKYNLEELKRPLSVCCSHKNEIFVGDQEHEIIFVFDGQFSFKRRFDNFNISKQFELECDHDNDNLLLVTVYDRNELNVLNSQTGALVFTKENLERPSYVRAKKDKIYLVSNSDCIVVLRHDTYDVIKTIRFDNWCYLRTLYIDNKLNIVTTAYDKNFPIAFLYLLDNEGNLLSKVYIHMKDVEDLVVIDDKKFFFNSEISSLCILEFE